MAQSQEHNEMVSRKKFSGAFSLLLSFDLLEMSFLQIIVSLTHVLPASCERKGRQWMLFCKREKSQQARMCLWFLRQGKRSFQSLVWLLLWGGGGLKAEQIGNTSFVVACLSSSDILTLALHCSDNNELFFPCIDSLLGLGLPSLCNAGTWAWILVTKFHERPHPASAVQALPLI